MIPRTLLNCRLALGVLIFVWSDVSSDQYLLSTVPFRPSVQSRVTAEKTDRFKIRLNSKENLSAFSETKISKIVLIQRNHVWMFIFLLKYCLSTACCFVSLSFHAPNFPSMSSLPCAECWTLLLQSKPVSCAAVLLVLISCICHCRLIATAQYVSSQMARCWLHVLAHGLRSAMFPPLT